jgi:hypothetical protein
MGGERGMDAERGINGERGMDRERGMDGEIGMERERDVHIVGGRKEKDR